MQLLTHSRMDAFKTCRKKHYFAYELGVRREADGKALRMGSAYHRAMEMLGIGCPIEMVCEEVNAYYDRLPEAASLDPDLIYERETVLRMVCAYQWRWAEHGLESICREGAFEVPLTNPETGKPTPLFNLAGKIDGIVKLADGRLAVIEHKLLGDDIGPDAELWRRMRIDHQVSLYVLAARKIGYEVDTVLYDVARKPTIKPTDVPLLDDDGLKIVLDSAGNRVMTAQGKPRQTGDTKLGFTLQSRPMTSEEWGEKLSADIAERPDFYFQRVEIPRMDDDLREYEFELWDIQRSLRDAQMNGRWYRTVNRNTCGFCPVFDLCSNRGFSPSGALPEGYVRLDDVHPELGKASHVNGTPSHGTQETTSTATETVGAIA